MAIKFSVVARKNPAEPDGEYKYYPQPQSSGEADFKSLYSPSELSEGNSEALRPNRLISAIG